ncbi:MAG TPA: hypothetical protein VM582_03985, partial [Candidatus Thermoplasmatota archaeon]|nr:hypothetical protein [Candidatus Thermoplasmatota archaeon]
ISFIGRFGRVHLTRPLRPPPPRHPLEVHPLARLHAHGWLELLQSAFPPHGPLTLVLWRPGEEPAFCALAGRVEAGWRWVGPPAEGWVVLWLTEGDRAQPI